MSDRPPELPPERAATPLPPGWGAAPVAPAGGRPRGGPVAGGTDVLRGIGVFL